MDGRAWRRVHGWVALLLAIVIVPVTLSGAMLMWPDAIDRLVGAPRFATSGGASLPVDRYVRAARPVLKPGERIAAMMLPDRPGAPVTVVATSVPAKGSVSIYLDPSTARVLEIAGDDGGRTGWLRRLHRDLLVTGGGHGIVVLTGVALILLIVSGLLLWWPGGRRRGAWGWWSYAIGVIVAVPLLALSASGVWIGRASRAPVSARPMARPAQPVSIVVARAMAIAPGAVRRIVWPTERNPDWTVRVANMAVKVADDSGTAVAALARPSSGVAGRSMRGLHDGSDAGPVWRAIAAIAGVAPLIWLIGVLVARRRRARKR